MLLSEKIMSLRKRNGWSQEELARQLNVSRQSVSKWESMASMPDIQKIMTMSVLFGVSTDYLLKDEMEDLPATAASLDSAETSSESATPESSSQTNEKDNYSSTKIKVSLDLATEYLDTIEKTSRTTAFAVMLFILGPAILGSLATYGKTLTDFNFTIINSSAFNQPSLFDIVSVSIMMLCISAGVGLLILQNVKLSPFKELKENALDLQYGVEAAVKRRAESTKSLRSFQQAAGVCLTILSSIPFLIASYFKDGLYFSIGFFIAMFMVAFGVFLLVDSGIVKDSYNVLLQKEEFSYKEKTAKNEQDDIHDQYKQYKQAYYAVITLIYFSYSFITYDWLRSWIIWPLSALLYHAVISVLSAFKKK
ncbi:MAG: helix-turn-helix domain-containing protein [Lancefieldella parvula]